MAKKRFDKMLGLVRDCDEMPSSDNTAKIQPVGNFTDLRNYLQPVFIQNADLRMDNDDSINNKYFEVVTHDTANGIITINRPIPDIVKNWKEQGIYDDRQRWGWSIINHETKGALISEIIDDTSFKIIKSYGGSLQGLKISFFNPFLNYELLSTTPTFTKVSGYLMQFLLGVYFKKNGEIRGFTQISVGGKRKYGLATSSDLIKFQYINAEMYEGGVGVFDKAVTASDVWMDGLRSPVWLNSESKYIAIVTGKNTSGKLGMIRIKFDEDFNISYADNSYLPDFITGYNDYLAQDLYFDDKEQKWHLFFIARKADLLRWKIYEAIFDDINDITTANTQIILVAQSTSNIYKYNSNHVDGATILRHAGETYCIVDGTARRNQQTPLSNNRQKGLYIKQSDGSWQEFYNNPVFCNPINIHVLHNPSLIWLGDHIGTPMPYFIRDGYMYMYFVTNSSTDSYQTGSYRVKLV